MALVRRVSNDLARFDDTRAALVFALNAHQVVPPGSAMNRMLAAVAVTDEPPKRRRRKGVSWMVPAEGSAEDLLARERDAIRNPRKRDPGNRPPPLAAADRAHQAGIILHHFGKLDHPHRIVLTGLCTTSHVPCSCRRPCCSGWEVVNQWRAAVQETCELLKKDAETSPGAKGLGTQPVLRQMVVEDFYRRTGAQLTDLARACRLTYKTVGVHRAWITEYLQKIEAEAWDQVAWLFDHYGITGTWNKI